MNEGAYAMLAASAASVAIFFATSAVLGSAGRERQTTVSRLGAFAETPAAAGAARRGRRGATGVHPLAGNVVGGWLQTDLRRAGLSWRVSDYVVFVVAGWGLSTVLAFLATQQVGLAIALGPLGGLTPVLFVRRAAGRRSEKLNGQVVEVVEIVASSLRAGFGFVQSLELAAREQPEPISGVLTRTIREINLGISTEDALERLVARTADPDLSLVITAVLIQRRVGGNLAEVLQNIGQTIRDRVQVKGQIKTLTSQARLSGWIVGLLPLALAAMLFVLSPAYISVLVTEPIGRILLAISAILEGIGFAMVRKIARVDY